MQEEDLQKIKFFSSYDEILNDSLVELVVIALPASMHYEYTKKALLSGKHVFLEKPMTNDLEKAYELNLLAETLGRTLLVDHTFLYTSQISKIKDFINSGELGKLLYYDSTRVALGNIQKDINVVWDLAVHDLAILMYLFKEDPVSVSACGSNFIYSNIPVDANINLFYKSGFNARIKVSWNYPLKIRDIFITGDERSLKYSDNLSHYEKLVMYDSKYYIDDKNIIHYCKNTAKNIEVEEKDAIECAIEDFIYCCKNNKQPKSNGFIGCKTINILSKIDESIKMNGKEIMI